MLIVIFVELLSFLFVADACFERKYEKNSVYVGVLLISLFCNTVLQNLLTFENSNIKTIPVLIILLGILLLFYKGNMWKEIFVVCCYYIILYAIDYGVILGIMAIGNLSIEKMMEKVFIWWTGTILAKSILLISCMIFKRKKSKTYRENKQPLIYWLQILVIPVGMILNLCLVIFYAIKENQINFWIQADIIILIAGSVLFLFLEQRLENERRAEMMNQVLSEKIESGENQAKLLMENYREQRKLTHDFQNHLCIIDGLLQEHNYESTQKYIGNLLQKITTTEMVVHTNHVIIDVILNKFYQKAKDRNIMMEFEITELEEMTLPEEELVIIMSNLLDNAIEAAEEVKKEKRVIVRALKKQNKLLISIRNTTIHDIISYDGKIKTTKKDKQNHGYGLENVVRLVKKNCGDYAIECKKGWFQITVILPYDILGT